ncbi:MAG: hypothetical protein ACRDJX_03340 [Solirubrobacteraceae bacterium]
MSTRYLTNVTLVVVGGFLLVTSQAFGVATFSWLMLASGIAMLVIAAPGVAIPARGALQRSLDYLFSLLGVWTIVASTVFGGLAVTWLGFASGAALALLAVAGLTAHELSTERVVHSLDVQRAPDAISDHEHAVA